MRVLEETSLIAPFYSSMKAGEPLYLFSELELWRAAVQRGGMPEDLTYSTLFGHPEVRRIHLSDGTCLELPLTSKPLPPELFAFIRNLVEEIPLLEGRTTERLSDPIRVAIAGATQLITRSTTVLEYAETAFQRIAALGRIRASDFARTAHYMGSKRGLGGFLLEAITGMLPSDGTVVDLMCGSGAATGVFIPFWHTIASDAQHFCRILAHVQGGGYNREKASGCLQEIMPVFRNHLEELSLPIRGFLETEDELMHADVDSDTQAAFQTLIDAFPVYPSRSNAGVWNPEVEVELRRRSPARTPYCLFTAYFANVYFGIRQCVEIDSLRFAIDQLESPEDRIWALGALLASLSAAGTTHAAHFAQPPLRPNQKLTLRQTSRFLERRSTSIVHEFSIRLLSLAAQSEALPHRVQIVPGPWRQALRHVDALSPSGTVVVYLDAPYKREEYSRYYHVLETLINYGYPEALGTGRTPAKGSRPNERFASEFFARDRQRLTASLVDVISQVIRRGWICAWSYATSGDADIPQVVSEVMKRNPCRVQSFATPYVHQAQGGKSPRTVREYLIVFCPE